MLVDVKQATVPVIMPEPADVQISLARLLCNIVALIFSLWYAFTRHFMANNGMGLSYSIEVCSWMQCFSTMFALHCLSRYFS